MEPAFLMLTGIALWGGVTVWNYRATELTRALFWSRLLAPVAAAFLFGAALYLIWSRQ
jgi:hypothetical protein